MIGKYKRITNYSDINLSQIVEEMFEEESQIMDTKPVNIENILEADDSQINLEAIKMT